MPIDRIGRCGRFSSSGLPDGAIGGPRFVNRNAVALGLLCAIKGGVGGANEGGAGVSVSVRIFGRLCLSNTKATRDGQPFLYVALFDYQCRVRAVRARSHM